MRQIRFLLLLFAAVALLLATGCMENRYTIRQVEQHPGGHFNTVETSGEQVVFLGPLESARPIGVNYWNCRQSDTGLLCDRVCDDHWDRVCRPELRPEFGRINKPGAGVVLARHIARTRAAEEQEALAEQEADALEDDERERAEIDEEEILDAEEENP